MATTPEAIVYISPGDPTNIYRLFRGDDATVDSNWTNAKLGALTDGTPVAYGAKYSYAIFNTGLTSVIGGIVAETTGAVPGTTGQLIDRSTALTLVNGANSNIAGAGTFNFARILGPTAVFSITGITQGVNGATLTLWNSTTYAMTIANDATSTAANRILTGTGANIIIPGNGSITMVYSQTDARWLVAPTNISATFVPVVSNAASGAIAIPSKTGAEWLTTYNAGAGAYTLAAPTAGAAGVGQDGQTLKLSSLSAQAHVITGSVDGFNAKGASGTLTFGGAIGDSCELLAYNGHWYVISSKNVTAA